MVALSLVLKLQTFIIKLQKKYGTRMCYGAYNQKK